MQETTMPTDATPDHRHPHDDHGGLVRDRTALLDRRRALALLGGASLAGVLAACSSSGSSSTGSTTSTAAAAGSSTTVGGAAASTTGATPTETQGPYPADGSNGPNLLTDGAIVRQDITSSIGDSSGTAEGIASTVTLSLVSAADGSPLAGAALYLWHCTASGQYSIYEIEDENYLRGVQVADDDGQLTFTTVFPGCYSGRWPHAHFEVFESVDQADAGSAAILISQLALPREACEVVYADERYGSSASNLDRLSLESDNIFSDGYDQQLATVTGTNGDGYAITLTVAL
jgi:protocatechuate 3,4-dioxygenase beta subunit